MKIMHNVALSFHPIFIPLNQLFGIIYEKQNWDHLIKSNKTKESMISPDQVHAAIIRWHSSTQVKR